MYVFEKKQITKITDPHLALIKMQSWCAYQERCQHDARTKLYELGVGTEDLENIIVKLIEENFINEERFAIQFATGKFNSKKWGRIKIKQELKQKRVSDYCLKKALHQIDEEDYIKTLTNVLITKKKLVSEKNPTKLKYKLANYALSKGYENDLIFDALNKI